MQNTPLDASFRVSSKVVARTIAGETIIVPLTAGIADMEDALFTLNPTGQAIWTRIVEGKTIQQTVDDLESAFDAPAGTIQADVLGLTAELEQRGIIERDGSA